MKAKIALLAAGLFGALQATAFAEGTNLIASATETKPQLQPIYPSVDYKLQLTKLGTEIISTDKVARIGPDSSRAWTALATHRENPTVFHDASTHEPQLVLLSFSFGEKTPNQLKVGR